ncbi:MAG: SMC-Scp complex subunit ScpB [Promethearchaeota archaeon]
MNENTENSIKEFEKKEIEKETEENGKALEREFSDKAQSSPTQEEPENDQGEEPLKNSLEPKLEIDTRQFKKNLIEASLFVAGSSLTIEEISSKLNISKKEIEELIEELAIDYLERNSALIISQLGEDTYQLQIKTEYMDHISKFAKGGAIPEKYLRTLTIIALKQPILKSTLVKIRGTGAYEHVSYLLDKGLISAIKKGRSQELTTTEKYAEMYGLPKNIEEMKKMMIKQLGIKNSIENSKRK